MYEPMARGSQASMRGRVSARWLRARVSLVLIDLCLALRSRPSTTPHHHVHRRPLYRQSTEVFPGDVQQELRGSKRHEPLSHRLSNRGGVLLTVRSVRYQSIFKKWRPT